MRAVGMRSLLLLLLFLLSSAQPPHAPFLYRACCNSLSHSRTHARTHRIKLTFVHTQQLMLAPFSLLYRPRVGS